MSVRALKFVGKLIKMELRRYFNKIGVVSCSQGCFERSTIQVTGSDDQKLLLSHMFRNVSAGFFANLLLKPNSTKMTLTPQESGEHIVKLAKYLRVLPDGIKKIADEIVKGILDKSISVENFSQHELHPKPTSSYALDWIFVIDTLNFCFWTPNNYTKYKVDGYTGYFALCAAINRAIKSGINIINPSYYAYVDMDTLRRIFRSDDGVTEIPLLEKRLECLHEVGHRLLDKWEGEFENVVKEADGSAVCLLELIVTHFKCFRDEADYKGERVSIYKRAQILIGDVWSCYGGKGLGCFTDIDEITMFADYRVPQVLVHFGSLEYTPELLEILKNDTMLQNGDPIEIEIRGASIYIVEKVKEAVRKTLKTEHPDISEDMVNSIIIDHYLWDYRRRHADELESIPFHKVQSIYY